LIRPNLPCFRSPAKALLLSLLLLRVAMPGSLLPGDYGRAQGGSDRAQASFVLIDNAVGIADAGAPAPTLGESASTGDDQDPDSAPPIAAAGLALHGRAPATILSRADAGPGSSPLKVAAREQAPRAPPPAA
jgi:hypothetical protein